MERFSESPHAYIREKAADIEDIALRIVENLGSGRRLRGRREKRQVCFAAALLPSEMVILSLENVAGVVLAQGGEMTHVAILARSLDVPLFIADEASFGDLEEGSDVLLDGATGNIYIDPSSEIVSILEEEWDTVRSVAAVEDTAEGCSLEKVSIRLLANINLLRDVPLAVELGAGGVGLYRTEFPFLIRASFPSEDEQYQVYRRVLEEMGGLPVTFRTLDVGGEKALAYYDHSGEENPELGLRSIRFSLRHRDIFTAQIRAILRSSADGPLRIMFPMISSLDEYREARGLVDECRRELEAETGERVKLPPLGVMVEVPSLVAVIEEAAREADFLSVGTNDLVQYLLAADRGNEKVADYYCLHHPAVLRTLARIAGASASAGREVTVCGEMAHMDGYVPFLVGVGLRNLSVDPRHLPRLRKTLSELSVEAAEEHAAQVLEASTIAEAAEAISLFGET
jgi:phosphotransferase system enzyme I (PtsP)